MQIFELDEDALRKGWGGSNQFWFSLRDYIVRDVSDMAEMQSSDGFSQSAYFVSLGYIPYFVVTNEEVMRAYINSIDNGKLKTAFSKIDDKNYVESFWKYFNAYPDLANGFNEFENKYVMNKAVRWCEENGINYVIK